MIKVTRQLRLGGMISPPKFKFKMNNKKKLSKNTKRKNYKDKFYYIMANIILFLTYIALIILITDEKRFFITFYKEIFFVFLIYFISGIIFDFIINYIYKKKAIILVKIFYIISFLLIILFTLILYIFTIFVTRLTI